MFKNKQIQKSHSSLLHYVFLFIFCCCPYVARADMEHLVPVVVAKLPHELPAFTQGLAIEDGHLYESTGLYGQSSLRLLDLATGKVIRKQSVPSKFFAEGIAAFPDHIIQITWREKQALVYDRNTLKYIRTLYYQGDGWGLCREGQTVWMSNGTSQLTQRDLLTFEPIKTLDVRLEGKPLDDLNDLECVGDHLYANVWQKKWIVRIDKTTGEVDRIVDGSSLLSPSEQAQLGVDDVLNGIAFHPKTGTFFITGKGWPWIFEVHFSAIP